MVQAGRGLYTMTKNAAWLLLGGWKVDEYGQWWDPTGDWPDGMGEDEAARVQWGRDFNKANGYTPPAVSSRGIDQGAAGLI